MNCRFCGGLVHDGRDDWPLPDEWQECIRSHRRRIEELERRIEAMSAEEARHHAQLPFAPPAAPQNEKQGGLEPPAHDPRLRCASPGEHPYVHSPACYPDSLGVLSEWMWKTFRDRGGPTPAPKADRPASGQETQKTGIVEPHPPCGAHEPWLYCQNCGGWGVVRTDEERTRCVSCGWTTDMYETQKATDDEFARIDLAYAKSGILTKAMEYEIAVKEGTLAVPGSEEDR